MYLSSQFVMLLYFGSAIRDSGNFISSDIDDLRFLVMLIEIFVSSMYVYAHCATP